MLWIILNSYKRNLSTYRFAVVALAMASLLVVTLAGCNTPNKEFILGPVEIGIHNYPPPADFGRGILASFPDGTKDVNLIGYDLTRLTLDEHLEVLLTADFDSTTGWPEQLPVGFNPNNVMEPGKDPGLSIRSLHDRGITGKGIGIAIIDHGLLVDHIEYRDQLKHYEEIHNLNLTAVMHGAAVASIAVGKTVGVAPEANLYYIAETHEDINGEKHALNFTWLAKSLDRVVELNQLLPKEEKIRVVAIAVGWSWHHKGYMAMQRAVKRAKEEGIFVISSSLINIYPEQFSFSGLRRIPTLNPNDVNSYGPASWWADFFFQERRAVGNVLLMPADARCTASPTGVNNYVYYDRGGLSWSIPYLAGLYTLACQVQPDITPQEFWSTALSTGDTIQISKAKQVYHLGKIVNPVRLIEELTDGQK